VKFYRESCEREHCLFPAYGHHVQKVSEIDQTTEMFKRRQNVLVILKRFSYNSDIFSWH